MKSTSWWKLAALAAATVIVAACGGGGDKGSASSSSAPAGGGSTAVAAANPDAGKPQWQALIEQARKSNRVIRIGLEGEDPAIIKAKEEAFQKRFGFSVKMESEPGHASREIPVKAEKAAEAGKGVVDFIYGASNLFTSLLKKGYLAKPPWEAIYEGYPLAKTLREAIPDIPGGPNGTKLGDYCMQEGQSSWVIVYNTNNVKASEVKGIKFDDLANDKWKNRLALDSEALGFYVFPFAKGWTEDRMRILANNVGANGAKLIPGGSNGVIQAIIQGEGDIGIAAATTALTNMKAGAPIDMAFAEFLPGGYRVTCLLNPPAGDPAMAALFWAWHNFDGLYTEAAITGGGALRLTPAEVDKFPLAKKAKEAGLTEADLVNPRTVEENDITAKYRKTAIDAMKEGIATKKKITQ